MPTVTFVTFVLYSLSGGENRDGCGQSFEPKTAKNKENTSEPAYVILSSHRRISESNVQSLKSNRSKTGCLWHTYTIRIAESAKIIFTMHTEITRGTQQCTKSIRTAGTVDSF